MPRVFALVAMLPPLEKRINRTRRTARLAQHPGMCPGQGEAPSPEHPAGLLPLLTRRRQPWFPQQCREEALQKGDPAAHAFLLLPPRILVLCCPHVASPCQRRCSCLPHLPHWHGILARDACQHPHLGNPPPQAPVVILAPSISLGIK